jgi:hypothetical protein
MSLLRYYVNCLLDSNDELYQEWTVIVHLGWQCGMVRSNAAAACGRTPHAAPHAALLCGSIHAHFAAFNAVPHAASACRILPHAVSPLILNKIYLLMIAHYYLLLSE